MSSSVVKADAKFLRRVFFGLVGMTLMAGAVAGFTTFKAIEANAGNCQISCQ